MIGDAKATVANYDEMRRRGFDPIPIFTRGSDPALLEYCYSTTDLVGVGGLVDFAAIGGIDALLDVIEIDRQHRRHVGVARRAHLDRASLGPGSGHRHGVEISR